MTVEEHYSKETARIRADQTVEKAALLMRDETIGCVVAVDENDHPVGVLTDRDLAIRVVAAQRDPMTLRVEEVMSKPLVKVGLREPLDSVLETMAAHGVRRAPVVANRWCSGILSVDDVLLDLGEDLHDIALASRKGLRHARRHEQMERMLHHLEESVSDGVSWMGKTGAQAKKAVGSLVRDVRSLMSKSDKADDETPD